MIVLTLGYYCGLMYCRLTFPWFTSKEKSTVRRAETFHVPYRLTECIFFAVLFSQGAGVIEDILYKVW